MSMVNSPPADSDGLALALALDPAVFSAYAGITPDPWQAKLLRSKAPRILVNTSRQSGKSTCLATLALHTALYTPQSTVVMLSASLRQSGELFYKAALLYRQLGKPVDAHSETALRLSLQNGSRLISLPATEATIRGLTVDLLLIDESAYVEDETYFATTPMLATKINGRIIAASTPFGTRGWWHEAWRGISAEGDALAEVEDWQRFEVTALECPRITPEYLERERRTLGPLRFKSQYMCSFEDDAASAFMSDEVDAAIKRFPRWEFDIRPRHM